jgi:hypothetical protein
MKMLQPAKSNIAFAKFGLYGDAGSGKTFTAMQFAIGLQKLSGNGKPVAMFDTEPAAAFLIPFFKKAGIEFVTYQSRALKDLMAFMDEAEAECSVAIIDSVTHIWRDTQESYIKAVNEKRRRENRKALYQLEFQHWRPIKAEWAKFTDRFLSSRLHVIVCGRAGTVYEYQKNEDNGKMELISTGTKMATEKELGYEPSLLIEMVKHREGGKIINRALIEKDRTDQLNGMEIDRPTFESIKPHIDFLNIGGEHFGSLDKADSSALFDGNEDGSGWDHEKRQREIFAEEIKALFVKYDMDGTSAAVKKSRLALLEQVFGTAAWTAIETQSSDLLRAGLQTLRGMFEDQFKPKQPEPFDAPEREVGFGNPYKPGDYKPRSTPNA